jgi:ubiquinone/menaquinone biosynthesis C-methylase UbiE
MQIMDDKEVGKYWDENAKGWIYLARKGYDVCRDYINSPAFMELLGDVSGLKGLDIGCGEGNNTRLVAKKGAKMNAFDISEIFIKACIEKEHEDHFGIEYQVASAHKIPFPDSSFDFAMATMSIMDIPQPEIPLKEAFRVIKPGGFLQFSICHPCFATTPSRKWLTDEDGKRSAIAIKDYFEEMDVMEEWTFGVAPEEDKSKFPKFKTPCYHITLSSWLNLISNAGFWLQKTIEPTLTKQQTEDIPYMYDARIVPWFIIFRCKKP